MNAGQVTPARRIDGGCGCGARGGRWVRQGDQVVVLLSDIECQCDWPRNRLSSEVETLPGSEFVGGDFYLSGDAGEGLHFETALMQDLAGVRLLFERLPQDRDAFRKEVEQIRADSVNLPSILVDRTRASREFPKPIVIKKLSRFAIENVFGHLAPMQAQAKAHPSRSVPWIDGVAEVMRQPGANLIDPGLALVIATRESGSHLYSSTVRKGRCQCSKRDRMMIDTFRCGGIDTAFADRLEYVTHALLPETWRKGMGRAGKRAACIRIERLLGLYFVHVGLTRVRLRQRIASEFFASLGGDGSAPAESRAEREIQSLTSLERRIWVALTFGAHRGGLDLATVSPGGTGVRTVLKAFHDANVPLNAITNIPRAASKTRFSDDLKGVLKEPPIKQQVALRFLNRLTGFDRLNIATKTAIVAEALDRHLARSEPSGSCVRPSVGSSELELQMGEACDSVAIAPTPTPGKFYTIKSGIDSRGLEDLAARAYRTSTGIVALAQRINNHPYNRRFWLRDLATRNYPEGRISFSPRFTSNINAQADARGAAPRGNAFATIYIPER